MIEGDPQDMPFRVQEKMLLLLVGSLEKVSLTEHLMVGPVKMLWKKKSSGGS